MNASTARKIIEQALEDETYEGEVPDDDAKAIEEAQGLVDMAKDAWAQNIKGEEVENILKLAGEIDGDEDATPKAKPKAKPKPAAKEKPAARGRPSRKKPEPEPEPEPEEEESDPRAQEEPWEDYDKDGVDAIIEGIEVWAEGNDFDSVQHVLLYEDAHKNRKRIVEKALELLPDDMVPTGMTDPEPEAEEEPEADASAEDSDAEDTATPDEDADEPDPQEEPFEGYEDLKIKDIKEALDEYLESDEASDDDKIYTLKHVIAYESVHKTRTSLLDYLDEKLSSYTEANDGEEPQAEEAGAGEDEDAAASTADEGAADGDQGGEEDGEKPAPARAKRSRRSRAAAADGASDSQGERVFRVTANLGDNEFVVTTEGKYAVAGFVLDLIERGATSISVDG